MAKQVSDRELLKQAVRERDFLLREFQRITLKAAIEDPMPAKQISDRELSAIVVRATVYALGYDPLTHWIERPTGGGGRIRIVNANGPVKAFSAKRLQLMRRDPAFNAYIERAAAGKAKRPPPMFVKVKPPGVIGVGEYLLIGIAAVLCAASLACLLWVALHG